MISKLKSLSKDTAIYGSSIVLGRFLNFLLTPLYTNFIPEKGLAFIIYIYSTLAFINIAYSLGMETAFFRFSKQEDSSIDKKSLIKIVFSNSYLTIFFFSLINSSLIIIFSNQISSFFSHYSSTPELIRYIALLPLLDALVLIPFAYLRITNQAKKFSILRFLAIFFNVIFNVILVSYLKMEVMGVILSNVFSSLLALIIFSPLIIKNLILKINFKLIKQMAIFALPTIPASFAAIILQVADRQIMEFIAPQYLATYGVNYRLAIPMMMLVSMFEYAWKPFYLNHFKDPDAPLLFSKALTYFTYISMILIILWTFSLDFLVKAPFLGGKLINPIYWKGLSLVPIVLFGYYFYGVFTNLTAGFIIEKQTKYLPIAVGISAILNIILNIILIPTFAYIGAAWATFWAYLLEALIIYIYAMKIYPINYELKKLITLLALTGIIIAINSYFTSIFHPSLFILLLLRFLLILIYSILLYIFGIIHKFDFKFFNKIFKS
jgi:O-antigen/teichoic acid export membrane protein